MFCHWCVHYKNIFLYILAESSKVGSHLLLLNSWGKICILKDWNTPLAMPGIPPGRSLNSLPILCTIAEGKPISSSPFQWDRFSSGNETCLETKKVKKGEPSLTERTGSSKNSVFKKRTYIHKRNHSSCYGLNSFAPNFICWSPNPQYLRCGLIWRVGLYRSDQVKMRSLE